MFAWKKQEHLLNSNVIKKGNFFNRPFFFTFRSRLFLVAWCPDSARIKKKMVYSASFDSLKKAFTGVQKIIQANGADEVEQSVVENLLRAAART